MFIFCSLKTLASCLFCFAFLLRLKVHVAFTLVAEDIMDPLFFLQQCLVLLLNVFRRGTLFLYKLLFVEVGSAASGSRGKDPPVFSGSLS